MPASPERLRPSFWLTVSGSLALLWPVALNWHPYLFWDTYGYFLQGKAYAALLLGALGLAAAPPEAADGLIGAAGRMLAQDASIRSPTFSLLLYGLAATGGFWLVAALNALAAMLTLEIALTRLFRLTATRRLLVLLILLPVSTLPWFASFLMPDLLAGLLILAAATLVFAARALRRWERAYLIGLMVLAASAHGSHLLLGLGLVVLAWLLAERGHKVGGALRLILPLLLAVLVLLACGWVGFGSLSPTPRAPPFLLARSWEDGPVRAYLETRCGHEAWALCSRLQTLPSSAQELLWAREHSYWTMDEATRAAVRSQELAVLVRAVAAYPLLQLEAALRNAGHQLARFGLSDLVLGRGAAVTAEDYTFVYLPASPAARHGLWPFTVAVYGVTAVSIVTLAGWSWHQRRHRLMPVLLFVFSGLVLNAILCGALSGPHDRYQARVIWLVPLMALAVSLGRSPALSRARDAPRPEGS